MTGLPVRKIIHVDMDAFFASVEQRDFPEYRGKPIAVGGSQQRGVVAAASYEARRYGVRSAMSSVQAAKRCPELIFVKSRFDVYRQVSQQIRQIFGQYTDLVEPLSLDEAYLDVTENKKQHRSATHLAQAIKDQIFQETELTASAGVSYNKFLAKIASDINKPNGLKVILPEEAEAFLEALSIEKFHGIGKVTAQKMRSLGIHRGYDLKQWSEEALYHHFGKAGRYFYKIVRGTDDRLVNPERVRKSLGAERTFDYDLETSEALAEHIQAIAQILHERMQKNDTQGYTLTLKVKYADFTQITRSISQRQLIRELSTIQKLATGLLHQVNIEKQSVRLLGLSVSNLKKEEKTFEGQQLSFIFPGA